MLKRIAQTVLIVAAAALLAGCCSTSVVSSRNARVETRRVLQAQAIDGGKGAALGVDMLALTPGYFAAWRETPGLMAAATAGDVIPAVIAGWLVYDRNRDDDDGKKTPTVQINGSGNTTIYNQGGDASYTQTQTPPPQAQAETE